MLNQETIVTAKSLAEQVGLDPVFVLAIIHVESGGNRWACRFEPGFLAKYLEGKSVTRFGAASADTERTMRATSYGLMQVMGQVAREHGCKEPFLTTLCDTELGISYGCKHLSWLRSKLFSQNHIDYTVLAAAYNGGLGAVKNGRLANPEYPAKVMAAHTIVTKEIG